MTNFLFQIFIGPVWNSCYESFGEKSNTLCQINRLRWTLPIPPIRLSTPDFVTSVNFHVMNCWWWIIRWNTMCILPNSQAEPIAIPPNGLSLQQILWPVWTSMLWNKHPEESHEPQAKAAPIPRNSFPPEISRPPLQTGTVWGESYKELLCVIPKHQVPQPTCSWNLTISYPEAHVIPVPIFSLKIIAKMSLWILTKSICLARSTI